MLLTSILKIKSDPAASKLIPMSEGNIKGVGDSNMVDEVNRVNKTGIVNKANTESSKSRMGFFIPGARLIFAKLRQSFITTPILHHYYPECHV